MKRGVLRQATLRTRLLWLVGAALLPAAILAVYGVIALGHQQQSEVQQALVERARAVTSAVEHELANSVAALKILALSESLDARDIKRFYAEAAAAAAIRSDWDGVILVDLAGNRLLNTRVPWGARIAGGAPVVEKDSFDAVLATGKPSIGNIATGPGGQNRFPIRVPVIRDGKPRYVLTAIVKPDLMLEILAQQKVPAQSVSTIFDGRMTIVARSRNHEQYVGKPVSATLQRLMGNVREGWGTTSTLEGQNVYSAFSRSGASPWGVALGIPQAAAEATIWRSYVISATGIVLSLALGGIMSAWVARRISQPIARLGQAAQAVGRGEIPETPRAGIPELDEVSATLATTALGLRASEERLRQLNATLEARVEERTKELEAFSYSVSHDLRAPLRTMTGFAQILLTEYDQLTAEERNSYLERISAAADKMALLIDGLLSLSRLNRREIRRETVDLSALARKSMDEIKATAPARALTVVIQDGLVVEGDRALLEIALQNLLHNAWKFSAKQANPRIEVGRLSDRTRGTVYFVRDNGAGFNMAYESKLFGAFQRLHADSEFDGHGIGLATVQRVIHRHDGKIWAEAAVGQGATFYFTLT